MSNFNEDFEKELKAAFLEEAEGLLSEAEQNFLNLENPKSYADALENLYRIAHNLKGGARAVGFSSVTELSHRLETVFTRLRKKELSLNHELVGLLLRANDRLSKLIGELKRTGNTSLEIADLVVELDKVRTQSERTVPTPETTIPRLSGLESPDVSEKDGFDLSLVATETLRVSLGKIERLLNHVGELVILKNILVEHKHEAGSAPMQRHIIGLEKLTREIQLLAMSLRMIPVKSTFLKMRRIVRDTSLRLGKETELTLEGEDTEIDKLVLEGINDPLMHLVHNALDHGLEDGKTRESLGKPKAGHVRLSAYTRGDSIIIECADDGRGMDPDRLVAKAVEKGILPEGAKLTPQEAYEIIFMPGFSTSDEVTDISGRGVGMDVVRANVARLGGKIEIQTSPGKGTCFRFILPFTLAIMDGMVVRSGRERYVIPLAHIRENLQLCPGDIHSVAMKGEVLHLRGEVLPLFYLSRLLGGHSPVSDAEPIVMVVKSTTSPTFSLVVDEILGEQQVVTKRLGYEIDGLPGITGTAILADGKPALVMDPVEVIEFCQQWEGAA